MSTIRGRARRLEIAGKGIRKNRYTAIAEDLRHQIVTGHLKPDQRMPSEQELAGHYGVTVLTLRQAQRILIGEGLIRKEHGLGTFVSLSAIKHRRIGLVCGLSFNSGSAGRETISPYYQDIMRFCHEAAKSRGLAIETLWQSNHPEGGVSGVFGDIPDSAFSGYIFLGCDTIHPLVQRAVREGLHHVYLGKPSPAERTVWFEFAEAAAKVWEELRETVVSRRLEVVVVSIIGEQHGAEALARLVPGGIRYLQIPNCLSIWEYERWGYHSIRRICEDSTHPVAFVFLDDIVARGGTRALLQSGRGDGSSPVAVVCGRQEVAPYGLPVTYVVHDTEAEARWAMEMLAAQIEGQDGGVTPRCSRFEIEQVEEPEIADWMKDLEFQELMK